MALFSILSSRLLYCRGAAMEAAAWTRNLSQFLFRVSNFSRNARHVS